MTLSDQMNRAKRSISPLSSSVSHTCATCCGEKLSDGMLAAAAAATAAAADADADADAVAAADADVVDDDEDDDDEDEDDEEDEICG